jgi:hypothetical protein
MRRRFALLAALALAVSTLALVTTPRPKAFAQAPPAADDESWRDDLARLAEEIQDLPVRAGPPADPTSLAQARENLDNETLTVERARTDLANAEETLAVARLTLSEYTDGMKRIVEGHKERYKEFLAVGDRLDRARFRIVLLDQEILARPENTALLLLRADLQKDVDDGVASLEKLGGPDHLNAARALRNARGQLEQLERYTKPTQIKTLQVNITKAESDVLAKKATLGLERDRLAKLDRELRRLQAHPAALRAVREALDLEKQWSDARAAQKPAAEVKRLEDQARSKIVEARRAWRDARLIRARQRLGIKE